MAAGAKEEKTLHSAGSVKDLKKQLAEAHKVSSRSHLDALEKNTSVERTPTALARVAGEGDVEMVKTLIEEGVDVNAETDYGGSPITYAAFKNQVETCKILIENGADLNALTKGGRTAIMIAAQSGAADIVELFIAKGAELETRDKDGRTALMLAAAADHGDVCRKLVAGGADMELKEPEHGDTALWIAARLGKCDSAKALCDLGADFGKHDEKKSGGGSFAFDAARQCNHPDPKVREAIYDVLLDADLDREDA